MTVGQTIEAKIVVDAKQAQANVDLFNKSLSVLEKGAATAGARLDAWQKSAKDLQSKMGPAAAAISSVSSALGQSGGAAGQAVAAFGQLAAAFGAGGPLGVAIVATTVGLDKIISAQKEATAAEENWRDALSKTLPHQERTRDVIKSLAEEAERYATEIKNAGKTQYEVALAAADIEKTQLETRLANIDASERLRQLEVNRAQGELESARAKGDVAGMQAAQERLDTAVTVQKTVSENARTYREQVKSIEDSVWKIAAAWEGANAAQAGKKAGAAEPEGTFGEKDKYSLSSLIERMNVKVRAQQDAEKKQQDATEAAMREIIDMEEMFAKQERDIFDETEKARTKAAEEAAKDRVRIAEEEAKAKEEAERKFQSAVTSITMDGVGIAVSATNEYVAARIKGEEDAEAAFASSVMAQAGQALISYGTQLGGKAIMDAFIAPPLAAAEGAAAAGLIAAGIGLGGAATAMQHTAAGGTVGQALPEDAKKDRGASPRTGGGGGSSGPFVLNISYGVGGPLPEDTAREIHRVMRTNDRRRGTA